MAKEKVVYVTEEKRSGGGCLSKILIGFVILILIAAVSGGVSDDNGNSNSNNNTSKSSSYTQNPTKISTESPTATPKPTETPKPTATPEPNYGEMAPEEAAQLLAQTYGNGNGVSFKSASEFGGIVLLEMKMEPYITKKSAVRGCCNFSLNLAEHIFDNKAVDKIKISYYADGWDEYRNEITLRAMEITISRETAEKINYENMYNHLYSSTYDYLSITDEYYVHPDLKKGVYD